MATETFLDFVPCSALSDGHPLLLVIGRKARLEAEDVRALLPAAVAAVWSTMLAACKPGDSGASVGTFSGVDSPARVTVGVLPEPCSRHNSPARPHAIASLVAAHAGGNDGVALLLALDDAEHALPAALAAARSLPSYSRKTSAEVDDERFVRVGFLPATGTVSDAARARIAQLCDAVRFAASLTDMPPDVLHTDAFVDLAESTGAVCGARVEVLRGEALRDRGYGGLWGVGKASTRGPALVVLSYEPEGDAVSTVALVGKGIVYDTGGLSIKGKDSMPGMKGDLGGAAAVLGAFRAAATLGCTHRLHAILCIAENSVGPEATRPDDILTMYSGKTVEVNNTDAEGRLVLGDGVAHAVRHLAPDVIVDLATLTGAQLMATGKRHAAIMCNDDALEARAIAAGKRSGDLVHPLPYVPEFFRREFKSEVADLKNSVKDRMNAQASCAGQFIAEHLGDFKGPFLHIDLAGPSGTDNGRGTGFGVGLLAELFGF